MSRFASKDSIVNFIKNHIMYLVLLVLLIFFALQSSRFLTVSNLVNILNQSAYQIVVGVGIAFIMLSGAIDLSVGYQISTISVVMGILMTQFEMNFVLVIVIALALGVVMSLINGVIYVVFKVFPFIITLATQYIFWGISYMLSGSSSFLNFPSGFMTIGQGYIGPIPISIIIMIVCVAVGAFILNRTYFGRYIYGIGSNPQAISLAGVNINKMNLAIFALAGFFTALGTVMLVSTAGSSASTMGVGTEFTILAGCMLGGIKMGGGGGKISSVIVGMLILTVLSNGMQLMQLGINPQRVAMGFVLLAAIGIDKLQSSRVIRSAKHVTGEPPAPETALNGNQNEPA